jgi:hypothetical protein
MLWKGTSFQRHSLAHKIDKWLGKPYRNYKCIDKFKNNFSLSNTTLLLQGSTCQARIHADVQEEWQRNEI